MAQTISHDYTSLENYFLRDRFRFVSGMSGVTSDIASIGAEKRINLHTSQSHLERWAGLRTVSINLEKWIEEHKESLEDLKKLLSKLLPQLANDWKVEVKHDDEAILFCANQGLIKCLGIAESLIREYFPTVGKVNFSIEYDPETSDKWVSADIEVYGEIDQVIAWEDEFVKEWVATVPYPERNMIRLSCDII